MPVCRSHLLSTLRETIPSLPKGTSLSCSWFPRCQDTIRLLTQPTGQQQSRANHILRKEPEGLTGDARWGSSTPSSFETLLPVG